MNIECNGQPVETGCVFDNHFGWHNHARLINLAHELGFELSGEDLLLVQLYDEGNDDDNNSEVIFEMMEEAEAWLNEHTTEGYVWYWFEGDFRLDSAEDAEEWSL
jgi:hypothetical protein